MQVTTHDVLDWVLAPVVLVVGYFGKLTLDNDTRIAVMEQRLKGIDEKLTEIRTDVKELKSR